MTSSRYTCVSHISASDPELPLSIDYPRGRAHSLTGRDRDREKEHSLPVVRNREESEQELGRDNEREIEMRISSKIFYPGKEAKRIMIMLIMMNFMIMMMDPANIDSITLLTSVPSVP